MTGRFKQGPSPFTYKLNSDGSGTIAPTAKGPAFAFALNSVVSGLGKALQFLDTN